MISSNRQVNYLVYRSDIPVDGLRKKDHRTKNEGQQLHVSPRWPRKINEKKQNRFWILYVGEITAKFSGEGIWGYKIRTLAHLENRVRVFSKEIIK
jgi:hypothetical protein